jgi:hypothetical protein
MVHAMSRVFLSHSHHDRDLAQAVHGWLSEAGHNVFLDAHPRDGIGAGEDWERRLHEELRRADAVVCIVTAAYAASRWCTAEVAVMSPDGRTLASGDADGTVALWDLGGLENLLDHTAEFACTRTGGGLDRADWRRYIDGLPYRKTS